MSYLIIGQAVCWLSLLTFFLRTLIQVGKKDKNKHFTSGVLPGGDGAIPQQPVDKLFSYNAVGVGPQPVSVVLELHPCAVVANFLPQVLQLGGVL